MAAERSVENWASRVRNAVEYEADCWCSNPLKFEECIEFGGVIAALCDVIRERSNSAWAWLDAPTPSGGGYDRLDETRMPGEPCGAHALAFTA